MQFKNIDLSDFIISANEPTKEQIQIFKELLAKYISNINEAESEEHQKNKFNDFLKQHFNYEINTKNRIDSAIYENNKAKVLIEFKRASNKGEFPKNKNLECKAFYELIFYFFIEHFEHKNNEIKFLMIANPSEIFIIKAREFLHLAKDSNLKKAYENTQNGLDKSSEYFYAQAQDIIKNSDLELSFCYINLGDLANAHLIYQALCPQFLLEKLSYFDANSLNYEFYNELLYILGLKEVNKSGKILIELDSTPNSMASAIKAAFGIDDFEVIFSLITLWNNRILFLRLLEANLISIEHIDRAFLDIEILGDFGALNNLFFEILAKDYPNRNIKFGFLDNLPYLNSSLFEKSKLENKNYLISALTNAKIKLYKSSILKKSIKNEDLNLLEYMFAFLHAYNFTTLSSDIKDGIV